MLKKYFEDDEYEKSYIDHERQTVRAILHTQNDTWLFVKIQGNDLFGERNHIETIGGGVEEGEDLVTALHREVMEETGYTVLSEQPLGEITDHYNLIHRRTCSHFFLAEVDTRNCAEPNLTEQEKTLFEGIVELTADEALEILRNPQNPCSRLIYRRDILAFEEAQNTRKKKISKGLGLLFLSQMVLSVVLHVLIHFDLLDNLSVFSVLLIGDIPVALPAIMYILLRKLSLQNLSIRKIAPGTFFMMLPVSLCVWPMLSFANILSQFLVPNVVASVSDELFGAAASTPIWLMALYIGVLAPVLEELVFRCIYANQFKSVSSPLSAVVLSGLLFGLFHMNLNQFGYATVLGIIGAIVNIASGSVLTSMIVHVLFNSFNVFLMIAANSAVDAAAAADVAETAVTSGVTTEFLIGAAVFLGILSIGAFFLLRECIRWIAWNESRSEELRAVKRMPTKKELVSEAGMLFTVPMVMGIGIAIVLTILFTIL